ncbi:limbic system-associated membrane protein-like isoform X1 [Montipora capricornis]|uniref:limbic system-associated membrane protein-like isoform X1 n=1 Tax=Montipora capricornis TaxID=246305 RepID=UPI0035F18719
MIVMLKRITRKERTRKVILTLLYLTAIFPQGLGLDIVRLSTNPVRVIKGDDAILQWAVHENITTPSEFENLVFGLWRNGHLATYITTVTRNEQVIPNPAIKEEAPQFVDRVKWRGDLSKSLAVFQISDVGSEDQMEFGITLNFGPFRNLLSDSLRLEIQAPPTIAKRSRLKVTVVIGNQVLLVCEADGFPIPQITWKKDGQVLHNGHNRTELIIENTNQEDAGDYECEASNSVGTANYSSTVIVNSEDNRKTTLTTAEIALLVTGATLVALFLALWFLIWGRKNCPREEQYQIV